LKIEYTKDRSKLLQKADKWDFSNPPLDIIDLSESMVKFMLEQRGLGLAYNQCNLPGNFAIFAMRGNPENFIIINPRIIQPSEETIELDEGCLSFPNFIVPIKRARHVRVRFAAPNGEIFTKTFTDLTARIFQHEYEHTLGKYFFEGVSRLKLEHAIKKAKKLGTDYSNDKLLKFCKKE
jgi:peptide deformylase